MADSGTGFTQLVDINQIASDSISKLVQVCAKKICETVREKWKDSAAKSEIDYRDAFVQYLQQAFEKCSKMKTLLYRKESKYLYDFYECVGVCMGGKEISTRQIMNILNLGHNIIISGTGGIGKTTMLKHFFLDAIQNTNLIPIFVELRSINEQDMQLDECIYRNMCLLGFQMEKKYFDYSLEAGCYVFLFDGYDEIKQEKMEALAKALVALSDRYPDNYFIISSRPMREFIGWNSFLELEAENLTKEQALSLIRKLQYDEEVKQKFLRDLERSLYDEHESFASNPLLLTIMLLTYEEHASIPDRLNDFYEQAFLTLFNSHDATKGAFVRDIRSRLPYNEFKNVFAHFCFKTYFKGVYEFTEAQLHAFLNETRAKLGVDGMDVQNFIYDLTHSVCMLIEDGVNLRFSHRSFQEYFAAVYTTSLSDETQGRLLQRWVRDNSYRIREENFLFMLHDMQAERCERNVFLPLLDQLARKFEANDRSYEWLLSYFFEGITVDSASEDQERDGTLSIAFLIRSGQYTKSGMYINLLAMISKLNGFHPTIPEDYDKAFNRFVDYFNRYALVDMEWKDLAKSELYPSVPTVSYWYCQQFDHAMAFLHRIKDRCVYNVKKDFDNLLDSL